MRALTLGATACIVLAACGSSDSSDTESTDAPPATEEPAADTTLPPETTTTAEPVTETTTSVEPAPTDPPEGLPTLTDRGCPPDAPSRAECHEIEVPADWDDPAGDSIVLPVVVLPAVSPGGRPDAIVIPAGGPGSTGSTNYGWNEGPQNQLRDIVLYDQRGAGFAEPSLECPEMDAAFVANLQRVEAYEVELQFVLDAAEACRARLEADGIDLDDYDSEAGALDLDAIREALGYEQWNILGISYGARLALTAMRSTPDGLRSVILDSVYDVTAGGIAAEEASAERAFTTLAASCAADAACTEQYGDVAATIEAMRQLYNAEPIVADVDLDDGRGLQTYVVNGDDAMSALFLAMYDTDLIPILPSIVTGLAAGDTGIIPELIRRGVTQGTADSDGMQITFNCADHGGLDQQPDADLRAAPGRLPLQAIGPLCDEWPVEPTSPTYNEPVVSDIPTLVVAGAFDPTTPDDGSEAAAARLPNATYALLITGGHGVTGHPCITDIEIAFLEDPTTPPDTGCLATVDPISFP